MLRLRSFSQVPYEEVVAFSTTEINPGDMFAIIDKATGELESPNLKFKPWGKKKFVVATLKEIARIEGGRCASNKER